MSYGTPVKVAVPELEPQTLDDDEYFHAVIDLKLELVGGFLIDKRQWPERRERLLLALLKNVGLVRAVELVGADRWEQALQQQRP